MVTNTFDAVFSHLDNIHSIEKKIICSTDELPAAGEYHVLGLDSGCQIAVSTLSNAELADRLAAKKPDGLSIVGKTETENIGVEKIIKNVLAVPSIKYLVLCGTDSEGHFSGDTLLCLAKNGIDQKKKVIGSKGKKPVLMNTSTEEVEAFRNQIATVDMIGCDDLNKVVYKIDELLIDASANSSIERNAEAVRRANFKKHDVILAEEKDPNKVRLDKEGYFVIVPKANLNIILVEHYSNDNELLHVIKGSNARNIYWTIIEKGWISELSHAAYLGKELTLAEYAIKSGTKYVQDKA
ncbi:MAG: DUF4346 domain-containing protein [Sedimentibacter sp.]|uniref:DUF4346 domain-containing protein n=1 Tax=Sedimentibacter sp. TaxID=1960295 RepID=UPI00315833D6